MNLNETRTSSFEFSPPLSQIDKDGRQSLSPFMPIPIRIVQKLNEVTNTDCVWSRAHDDLHAIIRQIFWTPFLSDSGCIHCRIRNLHERNTIVQNSMGTMAQCRGNRGNVLREVGAIEALLDILWRLMTVQIYSEDGNDSSLVYLPQVGVTLPITENEDSYTRSCEEHYLCRGSDPVSSSDIIHVIDELEITSLDLAVSCLGALRDLACGSALNRDAILRWTPHSFPPREQSCQSIENGVHVLGAFVKRYDQLTWEEIISLRSRVSNVMTSTQSRGQKEMRLLTNAIGAVRNASHSSPRICQEFFNHGLVDSLLRRLVTNNVVLKKKMQVTTTSSDGSTFLLPNASCPWREACFRAAGSLINLAEKCPLVAKQLGSNRECIYLLIETWGGARAMQPMTRGLPLLHLGLAAILHAAENGALVGGLDTVILQILENEKARKRTAQRREEERKLR